MSSSAIPINAISAVVGITLDKMAANTAGSNLPLPIVLIGEANTANQSGLNTDLTQVTSAIAVAKIAGYGSPLHICSKILFPASGGGVTMPVYVLAQEEASGATAKVITITPSGTPAVPETHYLVVNGRKTGYGFTVGTADSATDICDKMRTAIASVFDSPIAGTGTSTCICTTKWKGLTANGVNITIDAGDNAAGVSYSIANTTAGSGTPTVDNAVLGKIGSAWLPILVNTYGWVSAVISALESFNGLPDPVAPTGRYSATDFKPLIAVTGSVADDPTSLTNASGRKTQVTIVSANAPQSQGLAMEAATNAAYVIASKLSADPQGTALDMYFPDMPGPVYGVIPSMNYYANREAYVQKGSSTVEYINGRYRIVDLVTTYHPDGDAMPTYRFVRDLILIWNVEYRYRMLQYAKLRGKTIVADSSVTTKKNCIKPVQWKGEVKEFLKQLESEALITNVAGNEESISVSIPAGNPNRIDTTFDYQVTGVANVLASTISAGFYSGVTA